MGYSFIHIEKIHSVGQLRAAYKHNYRVTEVTNASKELGALNEELVSLSGKTYAEVFEEKIKSLEYYQNHKYRSDAVRALEIMVSFSSSSRNEIDLEKWKQDNVDWLRRRFNRNPEKYGDNLISVMYHADEAGNVHCHAIVIPINEYGRLSAKSFIDGPKTMRDIQNDYGDFMKARHNLERGMEGSVADHDDIKKFYSELNNAIAKYKAPEIQPGETLEDYKARVDAIMKEIVIKELAEEKNRQRAAIETINQANQKNKEKTAALYEDYKKLKEKHKEHEELIREHGPIEEITKKLYSMECLQEAFSSYPDESHREEVRKQMNEFISYGNKEKEKKKNKKKEKEK